MLPFISAGPFALPSKPLAILIGIYTALWVLERTAARFELDRETVYSWGSTGVIAGFIGARLIYVAQNWSIYQQDLVGIFWPLTVGYAFWGGLLIAAVALIVDGRRKGFDLGRLADLSAPAIAVMGIAFVLGDFLGGPGFGATTNIAGYPRHWVQFYEAGVFLLGVGVWFALVGQRPAERSGWLFLITTAAVSLGFLVTIPFRGDPWLVGEGFHVWQWIALGSALLAFGLLYQTTPRASA